MNRSLGAAAETEPAKAPPLQEANRHFKLSITSAPSGQVALLNNVTVIRISELAGYQEYCHYGLDDPYPLLDRLREEEPVHWSPVLRGWIVTRYDDVLAGALDRRFANDRAGAYMAALPIEQRVRCSALGEHVSNWLGFTDPPKHSRLRALARTTFTPRLAEAARPRIEAIVDNLLDEALAKQRIDLVEDYAFRLPATIICELLGVPVERAADFQRWSDDMLAFTSHLGPSLTTVADDALASYVQLELLFEELVADRLQDPQEDLLTSFAAAEAAGEISRSELIGLSVFLLVAGHETTASLIATALAYLLHSDDVRNQLASSPVLIESAVEEFLRFESPIQTLPRIAREDVELRGERIAAGDLVVLHMGAANRDALQFPEPSTLNFSRNENRQLAFGWGPHFCLGAPLARVEASVALGKFIARAPHATPELDAIRWRQTMGVRVPIVLPARLAAT